MDNERLAKVETHIEYLVTTVAKMEPKLDHLLEWRWKVWGVTAVISVLISGVFELMLALVKHG